METTFNKKFVAAYSPKTEKEANEMRTEILHFRLMDKIRLMMLKSQMNQTQLSGKLGVSKGYVSKLFSGDKLLNLNILMKMQTIFGVLFELNSVEKDVQPHITIINSHILNL